MEKLESMDRTQALESGGGVKFGEVERLRTDIRDETKDCKEEMEEALVKKHEKEDKILEAGTSVREMVMNRRNIRSVVVLLDGDSPSSIPPLKRRKAQVEYRKDMQDVIEALESGEEHRMELLTAAASRDTQRIASETKRMEQKATGRSNEHNTSLRRFALEERRFEADRKCAEEQAQERRMRMDIQARMLNFMSMMNKK